MESSDVRTASFANVSFSFLIPDKTMLTLAKLSLRTRLVSRNVVLLRCSKIFNSCKIQEDSSASLWKSKLGLKEVLHLSSVWEDLLSCLFLE